MSLRLSILLWYFIVVNICKFSVLWDVKPDILTDPRQRSALSVEAAASSEIFGNIYNNIRFKISEDQIQYFKYLWNFEIDLFNNNLI